MSNNSYSDDEREMVINAIKAGRSLRHVAHKYDIPLGTVNGWWQRHRHEDTARKDTAQP